MLDWEHSGGFKGFTYISWLKLKIMMRTHIFLEPGENPNNERIFSISEEWGGNRLLTEESTLASILRLDSPKTTPFHRFTYS